MHEDIKQILLTKEQIAARVAEMGKQITADYQGKDLVVVVLLKGAAWFATDLTRAIDLPLRVDFMVASSYGNGTSTTGNVKFIQQQHQFLLSSRHPGLKLASLGKEFFGRQRGIQHPEHYVGLANLGAAPFNPHTFDGVTALPESRSIDEAQQCSAHDANFFNCVTGGAGNRGDNCTVVAQQGVEQGTLAAVRGSGYRYGDTVSDCVSGPERITERSAALSGSVQELAQPAPVGKLHILLTEVQFQFHEGRKLHQRCAYFPEFP